ncbi:hypothetical protein KXW24_002086 [Aspergillus fumigatus]|nr:hypothetical protein KXW24_002086 [Aspergillus fumigatus]
MRVSSSAQSSSSWPTLTSGQGAIINTITNFDRSQLANGGAHEDDFYNVQGLPRDQWPTEPGKTVKLQEFTDPSPFSIPAKTAMSRIIYSTTNANGTLVPASAYILWPFQPKALRRKTQNNSGLSSAPVVLWKHGTSGFYANGAPSTHRGLFYADIVPFALAEAGYAVVAPTMPASAWTSPGTEVTFRTTRGSFPRHLSSDYVVMGHSQGGAVAWGLSEILARNHTNNQFEDVGKGYRGSVLAAPPTDALSFTSAGFLAWIAKDLNQIYPPEEAVLQPGWHETWYAKAFEQLTNPGKRPFKGPILLVQGTEDQIVSYSSTKATMQETCKRYPGDPELLAVPQASHFAAINAAKQTLLRWIEDRFEHRPVDRHGCVESQLGSLLPLEYYQVRSNSFPLWAGESHWSYELPTAL